MGRVVGATLVALGAWVLIELLRKGRDFRLRSRWILVFGGTFAGLRRVREARAARRVSINHDHPHDHIDLHGEATAQTVGPEHDHDHIDLRDKTESVEPSPELEAVGDGGPRNRGFFGFGSGAGFGSGHSHNHTHSHRHPHTHELTLAERAGGNGNGTAAGIGVLHGIGFESPTQIAVFVASTSIVGAWAGVSLLVAWVLGLIIANTFLAVLAAYGLLGAERNFTIYATIAVFVAVASLAMGTYLMLGVDPPLPEL
jgi:ABC-type nickel/cobalt efflux system permease component RcnA